MRPLPRAPLLIAASLSASLGVSVSAQAVEEVSRLAGIVRIDARAEAVWDEMITQSAGGATEGQFQEALQMTFEDALGSADAAPSVVAGAPVTVACHVDTFYETGLIVYALRVQVEQPGEDGDPTITWIKSSVGSYTAQQMHLMFRLGEECAEEFLEDWRSAN